MWSALVSGTATSGRSQDRRLWRHVSPGGPAVGFFDDAANGRTTTPPRPCEDAYRQGRTASIYLEACAFDSSPGSNAGATLLAGNTRTEPDPVANRRSLTVGQAVRGTPDQRAQGSGQAKRSMVAAYLAIG
jgi:hypothetical protein